MSIFKISLPGYDVKSASPQNCVVDSDYPNPKINKKADPKHRGLLQIGLLSTYPVGTTTVFSMPHSYGYKPMVWATITDPAGSNLFGFQPYVAGFNSVDVKTDAKNMYVTVVVPVAPWTPNITLNISYAIFADNGAKN